VVLSMALTPLFAAAVGRLAPRVRLSLEGVDVPEGLSGTVLVVGFGRFGQVMSQCLLARGCDVTIIDNDVEMIRSASGFGFKIYYGDGRRLDVLRACGAGNARALALCIDDREAALDIVELARAEFPHAKLLVRSYDREHALQLLQSGVDFQIRETFESALGFGGALLRALGVDEREVESTLAEVRQRDAERVEMELVGGLAAGRDLLIGNVPKPTPFTVPRREARPLTPETAEVAREAVG
jgi:glutathione-regulated potassium-efflux system protein KefB